MSKCRRIQTQIISKKRDETGFIKICKSKPLRNPVKTKPSLFLSHSTTSFCRAADKQ